MAVTATDTHRAIRAVFKIESAKLIASLTRVTRDIGQAEELAQDALVAALERWPETGIPEKPAAWLMATAKHRAIDNLRRKKLLERKHEEIGRELETDQAQTPDIDAALDDDIGDDLLRLIFTACHPVVPAEARVALTLRLLGGLTTEEIARSFLQSEPTIAQRIVRAKKTIAEARIPFEVPRGLDRGVRLASVLEVIYLVFNEGYSATAGDDWMRPAFATKRLRLGRILAELAPNEPEVHGLVALMEIQASRFGARTGPDGRADPAARSEPRALGSAAHPPRAGCIGTRGRTLGQKKRLRTSLQAAIAACHARARKAEDTDWQRIASYYGELAQVMPSPVVELNRAVAVGMADGPAAGLALVDALVAEPSLKNYHLLPSVRGDLLSKLGRHDEARKEFERAAAMTRNERERTLLLERAGVKGA